MLTRIYADGHLANNADGYTLNPTLARQAGCTNYREYAQPYLRTGKHVSVEVLDETIAYDQALRLAAWGANVAVKVPCVYTDGTTTEELVKRLSGEGIVVNVTAICTLRQVKAASEALAAGPGGYLSIFAGRIADAGTSPMFLVRKAVETKPAGCQVIWASTREAYNRVQAEQVGCDIITVPEALWAKVHAKARPLELVAVDTVRQFAADAHGLRA